MDRVGTRGDRTRGERREREVGAELGIRWVQEPRPREEKESSKGRSKLGSSEVAQNHRGLQV